MTVMEPRVAERRKTVAEDRARKRLKWILVVIVLIGITVGTMWLIRSPFLSIREISVTGVVQSEPSQVLRALDMGIGTPTIDVDSAAITAGVESDPWVSSVDVEVAWPGSLSIHVAERVPVAPVLSDGRWVLVAADGGVIGPSEEPLATEPLVAIDVGFVAPGAMVSDPAVLGGLEFVDALSENRRAGARIRIGESSGLVAEIDGHLVRLGRPVNMAEKATVLEALLDDGVEDGASIDLIAPLRPAVSKSQPQVETEE